MRYNKGGEIVEIIIRDSTGAKIETHKFRVNDKMAGVILQDIKRKYDIKDTKDRDIEWLNKQKDW